MRSLGADLHERVRRSSKTLSTGRHRKISPRKDRGSTLHHLTIQKLILKNGCLMPMQTGCLKIELSAEIEE